MNTDFGVGFNALLFQNATDDVLEVTTSAGNLLSEVILKNNLVESKSEWRRLVEQGSVTNMESKEKVSDPNYKIEKTATYKIGKKRFVKIIV